MKTILNEEHRTFEKLHSNNHIACVAGRILGHDVVIASPASSAKNNLTGAASRIVKTIVSTFTSLRLALLIGIGEGVSDLELSSPLRLGDVDVSWASKSIGSVTQYVRSESTTDGLDAHTQAFPLPPQMLTNALKTLKSTLDDSKMSFHLSQMAQQNQELEILGSAFPGIVMLHPQAQTLEVAGARNTISRSRSGIPRLHYGTILSGTEPKAEERRRIYKEYNVLCVEMEAAGLMSSLPFIMVKGICKFSGSDRNELWDQCSAAAAAACAKELLLHLPKQKDYSLVEHFSDELQLATASRYDPITSAIKLELGNGRGLNLLDAPDMSTITSETQNCLMNDITHD